MAGSKARISVVLVHGAWADGSSWNDIIGPLLAKGLNVLAAPIPLTSLSDDVAALDRALERTDRRGNLRLPRHLTDLENALSVIFSTAKIDKGDAHVSTGTS